MARQYHDATMRSPAAQNISGEEGVQIVEGLEVAATHRILGEKMLNDSSMRGIIFVRTGKCDRQ